MYKVFYDSNSKFDCLYIVFDLDAICDKKEEKDNVVCLYRENKLIGINILNFSTVKKLSNKGFLKLDKELLDAINAILEKAGVEKLLEETDSGYKVAKVTKIIEHPLDERMSLVNFDLGDGKFYQTVTRYKNFSIGDKVVVTKDNTLKMDGTMFHAYISRNIEINVEINSPKDLLIGEEFKAAYIEEALPEGADFIYADR